jgi:hypothetical protein
MNPLIRLSDVVTPGPGRHRRVRAAVEESPLTPDATAAASPVAVMPPSVFDGGDLVDAVTDLCSRAGADTVEIGYTLRSGEQSPADWYAYTAYAGSVISERGYPSPAAACYALAVRLVSGVLCDCGLAIALDPGGRYAGLPEPWETGNAWSEEQARIRGWCLWSPHLKRWRSPCQMLPFEVKGAEVSDGQLDLPALMR